MRAIRTEATTSELRLTGEERRSGCRDLTVELDDFAWEAINREADRLGVSAQDLARFSMMYYLADLDSGRASRRLPAALVG